MGAIYLQGGVAALPARADTEGALRKLRHDIVEMSGSAVLLSCEALAGQREVLAGFQAARDDEYAGIVDKCRNFLDQLEKEHLEQHYSYAELQENQVDLEKIEKWFSNIVKRDAFAAAGRGAAHEALRECTTALDMYAALLYETEAGS